MYPANTLSVPDYFVWCKVKYKYRNWLAIKITFILIIVYYSFTCIFVSLSLFVLAKLMLMFKCISLSS